MSWADKKLEILGIAFLVMATSMYGMLFPLNMNVVAGTEISGHITSDTTWNETGSPYWIVGDTFVDKNVTLTIVKGVSVLFNGSYYFNVSGNLITQGDPTAGLVFTTNFNPDPPFGYWKGIHVMEEGNLLMEWSYVSYAECGIVVHSSDRGQGIATIKDSEIAFNRDCGISLGNYSSLYVLNSYISNNDVGLDLGFSMGSVIEESHIVYNNYGIIGNYSYSRVQHSTISNNIYFGVKYESKSGTTGSNNWYWNNTVSMNGQQTPPGWSGSGLHLYGAMYDTIYCNVIRSNGEGLGLFNSRMISTHHNDFIYNHNHASDDLDNHFDDGSEGNYWDDYNGTDANGDGIGDTPYYVDNNSVDHYPLMHPLGGCGVVNQYPVADANGPYFGRKHSPVYLDGTGSYDPDGTLVEYEWDFGDGSPKEYGMVVNHTYAAAGIYNVTLKVTDNDGATDNDTTYAEILDGYPGAPRLIDAFLSGAMQEDVQLSWELSDDDGSGDDDVAGYNIYRGTIYDPDCIGYSLVQTAPPGSGSWTDSLAGRDDPNTYFYCVGAVDDADQETLAVDQASKYSKHMATGMVLTSVPVVTSDTSITSVFQTVSYARVILYDANAGKRHNWKTFDTRKPYSDQFEVDHKVAVWVDVTSDSYLTVAGLVPRHTIINLVVGWNFVGYPSFIDRTVSDTLTVQYQTTETFDPMDPPWYLQRLADGDFMTAGEGYWIHVSEPFDWTLTN